MSFYRSLIVAVAAMGLATSIFAADENVTTNQTETTAQAPAADANQTVDANQATATSTDSANTDTSANATSETKVDLNKATAKELMKVKGLNAAKAKAIVAHRKKNGDFKAVEDLREVKGFKKMNEKSLKKIEDQLTTG